MDSQKKSKYVQAERNGDGLLVASGTLRRGIKIGSDTHKDFELKESISGDLLAAERDASMNHVLNFNAAVLARQLVRLGTFTGPFTVGLIAQMRTGDFNILREAQAELDVVGEAD